MEFKISPGALRVLRALAGSGFEAYLVGGCVRDLLRGQAPHDWDICTSALPGQVKACFPSERLLGTGLRHGTVTVLDGGDAYEVTTYRSDGPYSDGRRPDRVRFVPSLEEDLARRDFTMNAIAMDASGGLRDPFHGAADIRKGLIRCVGQPERRFREDGLRVMRALRFAAVLGFSIEDGTAAALHENRGMLRRVAAERLQTELRALLTGPEAGRVLRGYPDVLCVFWPELDWRCRDGWERTVRAVEAVRADIAPRLAMLLLNVEKPPRGGGLAEEMLRRLKFDNATRTRVLTLLRRYDAVPPPEGKAVRRLLNELGPEDFYLLLEVRRAGCAGQGGEAARPETDALEKAKALADEIIAQGQCYTLRDLALSGRDLLDAGLPPGPEVGRILRKLLEAVMDGEAPNERQALLQAALRGSSFAGEESASGTGWETEQVKRQSNDGWRDDLRRPNSDRRSVQNSGRGG